MSLQAITVLVISLVCAWLHLAVLRFFFPAIEQHQEVIFAALVLVVFGGLCLVMGGQEEDESR